MLEVKIDLVNTEQQILSKATKILRAGGIIVCPTETVYILAVDATNLQAINNIYEIKGRRSSKPIHVVVSDLVMAKQYVRFNKTADKLADSFLPGPLTIILNKKAGLLPDNLTLGLSTLGIRIPSLPLNTLLAKKLGTPYTATSANKSNMPNTYSVEDVLDQLSSKDKSKIDIILDSGRLEPKEPSTIIDCTKKPPQILRPGPITKIQIENALGS